jgi:hypothetical protein
METNVNLEKVQKYVIMETLIKFKMIEVWVNIIETLICIRIIHEIWLIIDIKKDKKEEEINVKESYEVLEHKYHEKLQQFIVELKINESKLEYKMTSRKDEYNFNISLKNDESSHKIPTSRESWLSIQDIFTKMKRVTPLDQNKTIWKTKMVSFINQNYMNDLVDQIVIESHYNTKNVMSIIERKINVNIINEIRIDQNFFSNLKQIENNFETKNKSKFINYYYTFFLDNLNIKEINNKGIEELRNLLKELQKFGDPNIYPGEQESKESTKELPKVKINYRCNMNLMRDFVKGNMNSKFKALVKPNIEVIDEVIKLEGKTVKIIIDEIKQVLDKKEYSLKKENDKNSEVIKKLQTERKELVKVIEDLLNNNDNQENVNEIKKQLEEKLNDAKEIINNFSTQSDLNTKEIEEIQKMDLDSKENIQRLYSTLMKVYDEKQKIEKDNKLINDLLLKTNIKQQDEINRTSNEIKKFQSQIETFNKKEEEYNAIITKMTSNDVVNYAISQGLLNSQGESMSKQNVDLQRNNDNLKTIIENLNKSKDILTTKLNQLRNEYKENLRTLDDTNTDTRDKVADKFEKDYNEKLNIIEENYKGELEKINVNIKEEKATIKKEIEELQIKLKKEEKKVLNLQSNLNEEKAMLRVTETRFKDSHNHNIKLIQENNENKNNLKNMKNEIETLTLLNKSLKDGLNSHKEERDKLVGEKINLEKEVEELNKQLTQLQGKFDNMQRENVFANNDLDKMKTKIGQYENNLLEKEKSLKEKDQHILTLSEDYKTNQEALSLKIKKINQLKSENEKIVEKLDLMKKKEKEEEEKKQKEKDEERRKKSASIIQSKFRNNSARNKEELLRKKEELLRKKEEEEKPLKELNKLKQTAIENVNIFVKETEILIKYIKSISYIIWNENKSAKQYEFNQMTYLWTYVGTDNKPTQIDNANVTNIIKKINEYNIIHYLTKLENYKDAIVFIKTFIETEIIDKSEIIDDDYSQFKDKDQFQHFRINMDKSVTFTRLVPRFISKLISTLNSLCKNEFLRKYLKSNCDAFKDNFHKSDINTNNIDASESYKKIFDVTMKSIRNYFKASLSFHDNEDFKPTPKTKNNNKLTSNQTPQNTQNKLLDKTTVLQKYINEEPPSTVHTPTNPNTAYTPTNLNTAFNTS